MPHLFGSQFLDNSGDPLASGKVYTYEGGTTTPLSSYPTYDDAVAGTNANANPLVLDSAGRGQLWLLDQANKVRIDTSADVTLATLDDVYGSGGGQTLNIASDSTIDLFILKDNDANALTIKEGSNNYINFVTTDSSEKISFGNASQNTATEFLGTGNHTVNGALLFNRGLRATNSPLDLGTGYTDITAARAAQDSVAGYTVVLVKPTGATDETYSFSGMTDGDIYIVVNDASNITAVIDGGVSAAANISVTAQQAQMCYYNSSLASGPGLIAI